MQLAPPREAVELIKAAGRFNDIFNTTLATYAENFKNPPNSPEKTLELSVEAGQQKYSVYFKDQIPNEEFTRSISIQREEDGRGRE